MVDRRGMLSLREAMSDGGSAVRRSWSKVDDMSIEGSRGGGR
jgi:hypothetical protein